MSTTCNGGLWVGLSDGAKFNFSRWATWCTPASIKVLTGALEDERLDAAAEAHSATSTRVMPIHDPPP